jgi:hypothetical protein
MGYHRMVDFQQRSADALKKHAKRKTPADLSDIPV